MRYWLAVLLICLEGTSFAEARYAFQCQAEGREAVVYACNRGNSSEGVNKYISVTAFSGGWSNSDYDLMYIYATAGKCDEVGRVRFSRDIQSCAAAYRDEQEEPENRFSLSCQTDGDKVNVFVCNNSGSINSKNVWASVTACEGGPNIRCLRKQELVSTYSRPHGCTLAKTVKYRNQVKWCHAEFNQ